MNTHFLARENNNLKQTSNKLAITDHAGRENNTRLGGYVARSYRDDQGCARRIREAIWLKRTPRDVGGTTDFMEAMIRGDYQFEHKHPARHVTTV